MICVRKFFLNLFYVEFIEFVICIMDFFKVVWFYDGFNEIVVSV